MIKTILRITLLLALAAMLGCGGGGGDEAQQAQQSEQAQPAAEVATHDCEGDCGMKDVPMDKLTQVDGKYLCAGCVKKAEAQKKADEHSGGGHSH